MTQGVVKVMGKCSHAASAKKKAILSAVLDIFPQSGLYGTRLEQIAELAGISKTNLLYYFLSREALYIIVLRQILGIWLASLRAFREDLAPPTAVREYIRLKLEVSRDHPQVSCLFRMEMLADASLLMDELTGDLKALINEKSALVAGWVKDGKLAPVGPQHLIFMIWVLTQHYADFAPQMETVTSAALCDEMFFNQTVEDVQRIIIEGIRPCQRCRRRLQHPPVTRLTGRR